MDAVVVEIAPPGASREREDALLRACAVAARPLSCVSGESSEPRELLALVVWEPDGSARIEVGVRQPERVEWAERRLSFSPADPETERWEVAGLTVGTVAAALARLPEPEVTASVTQPEPERKPEPEPEPRHDPPPSTTWGVDAALLVATGFDGSARAGGSLGLRHSRAALRLELRGSFAGDGSTQKANGETVKVSTLTGRVGVFAGAAFTWSSSELGVLAGPFVERVLVNVEPDYGDASRFVGGAELTCEFRQRFAERLLVFFAADVGTRFGSTFVAVDGQAVGRLPPSFAGARVGLGTWF